MSFSWQLQAQARNAQLLLALVLTFGRDYNFWYCLFKNQLRTLFSTSTAALEALKTNLFAVFFLLSSSNMDPSIFAGNEMDVFCFFLL